MPSIRSRGASRRPSLLAHAPVLGVLLATLAATPLVALAPPAAVAADEEPVQVRLETTLGEIVLELDAGRAPETVDNFLAYVDDDYYDGTIFHRVIEGFMIQGGGFTADFDKKGTRGPIRNEANNGLSNRRLTVAMARTNEPHSATAQFFINDADNTNLDHSGQTRRGWGYAVFGRVVEGHDVVEAISRVATGAGGPFRGDAPREAVVIVEAARVVPAGGEPDAEGGAPLVDGSPSSALPEEGATGAASGRPVVDGVADGAERTDGL